MSAQRPEEWYVGDGMHYTIWTKGKKGWTLRFSRRNFHGVGMVITKNLRFTPRERIRVLDSRGQLYVEWREDIL